MSEGALPLTPFIMSKANNKVLTKSGYYIIQARRASDSIISYLFSIISVIYHSAINYCLFVFIKPTTDVIANLSPLVISSAIAIPHIP